MTPRSRGLRLLLLIPLLLFLVHTNLRAQEKNEHQQRITDAGESDAYPGSNRVLLFDRTCADVKDSGLAYVTQERLWKVLTPPGALALRTVVLDYDPLSGHVAYKEARIYKKDGTVREIALDQVRDYAAPARAIYWGLREVLLPVGRLEAGDGLYVKSFRKGFTYALLKEEEDDVRFIPPMRGHFYDIVNFYDSIPVLEKQYTALMPSDKPLQFEVYNGEVTSSVRFRNDRTAYTWSKKNITPFKSEPNMVATSDVAPKLLLSTSPDWVAKSKWFYGVNEDYGSFEVTPEVQAKVDELLAGVEDDEEKIWILTHWVADEIRYSGVSMGQGEGYTLHKGEMSFRDRCGVCKDKAGMLVTMLRAAGFESYAAMTMAGSRIDDIPADQFNHSVTLVKVKDLLKNNPGYGEYKLLDPTWVPFMRELWSSAEQQQNYLPGTPEGADLQVTQLSPPENHYFRITGTSRLDDAGTLEGTFTLKAEGQSDASVRWNLVRRRQRPLWEEYFDEVMHKISPRAEILDLTYHDPYDLSKPMEVKIKYRIPRYALTAGDTLLFTPCVARYPFSDTASFLRMNLDVKERKHNFRARTSRLVEFSETVELPMGFNVSHLPEYDPVEGSAGSFKGGYSSEENRVVYEARLELRKRIYEPCDYESFCKAVKGMKHMMEERVVLSR